MATEKIDGTSMTAYVDPMSEVDGACSRDYDLLPAEGNTLWGPAGDRADVRLADGQVVRASFKVISNRFLLKHQDS